MDGTFRSTRIFNDDIASLEKKIQEVENDLGSAKTGILEKADQELKKQQLKSDEAVKVKSDCEKKLIYLMKMRYDT